MGRDLTLEQARELALDDDPEEGLAFESPEIEPEAGSADGIAARYGITPRELEVIDLLVRGMTNQEIADGLFITRRTATTHVSNILNKLGLDSRTAIVAWAVREGLG